jgi:hypothetical protein
MHTQTPSVCALRDHRKSALATDSLASKICRMRFKYKWFSPYSHQWPDSEVPSVARNVPAYTSSQRHRASTRSNSRLGWTKRDMDPSVTLFRPLVSLPLVCPNCFSHSTLIHWQLMYADSMVPRLVSARELVIRLAHDSVAAADFYEFPFEWQRVL